MKKAWNSPELWSLNADATEAGAKGGKTDGVWLENSEGFILIGTSGKTPKGWDPVPVGTH